MIGEQPVTRCQPAVLLAVSHIHYPPVTPRSAGAIYKETAMALTGIQIFKLLPKTNCKECGVPTCLAFAMNLASGKAELDSCPYVSDEAREQLAEASAPPIRPVAIGKGVRALTIGGETVFTGTTYGTTSFADIFADGIVAITVQGATPAAVLVINEITASIASKGTVFLVL